MKHRNIHLRRLTCAALILGLAAPAAATGPDLSDVVPDPVLRAVINQTLSTEAAPRQDGDPISAEDMKLLAGSDAAAIDAAGDDELFGLKGLCSDEMAYLEQDPVSLNPSHGIHSLEGMQYAVNLKSLDLSENSITDLSPLAGLENLTYLELDRNNISDLEPLSGLTGLEHLNLYNNLIHDITPLADLDAVNWFDLHYANRGAAHLSIDTLADMPALEYISIESNDLVNEDLDALSGLANLNYIKLNANHITDLTAISNYLEKVMAGEPVRIEVNNQSLPDWETAAIQAQPEGGDVTLTVPVITGVNALYGEPADWTISPAIQAAMAQEAEGVSAAFPSGGDGYPVTDQVVFTFANRAYGSALEEQGELCLTYAVTAMDFETWNETTPFIYTLYLPVELRQEPSYQAELTWEGGSSFVTIDTAAGAEASAPLTIRLNTAAGEPVELPEVTSIQFFVAGKSYDARVTGLEARDITVAGNVISFRAALTGEEPFSGAQYITPVVEYVRPGSEETEAMPRDTLAFHLFAGDVSALQVDDVVRFDADKAENGSITSRPVTLSIPGETVYFVDLQDAFDNRLATGVKQEDGTYLFTVKQADIEKIDHFYLSAAQFLYPPVRGELVVPDPEPSTGGSTSVTRYTLTATAGAGGSISPSGSVSVSRGSDKTFIITAGAGYEVADVLVDGKSVGAVSTYTFENVRARHTIEATFQKSIAEGDTPLADLPYTDVDADAWYAEAVAYAVEKGLMTGTSSTTFAPEMTLTRAMMAQILYNLEGNPALEDENLGYPYADVAGDAWYADAVYWARKAGLVSGYSSERFGPEDPITREQLASILCRYAGYKGQDVSGRADLTSFTDAASASSWAVDSLKWAVSQGVLSGKGGSLLDPTGTASRAEVAQMLLNYLK